MPKPTLALRSPNTRTQIPNDVAEALVARLTAQENPPSLTLAAPLPKSSTVAPKADRRNVERVGRVLGDGSRRGARTVRRLTVYLGASLGQRLELYSATTGDQKSDVVERAVAAYLDTLGA